MRTTSSPIWIRRWRLSGDRCCRHPSLNRNGHGVVGEGCAVSRRSDEALAQAAKGDWVTVSGRLVYEEYARQDGSTGTADKIIVQKIEAYTNGHDADEPIEIDE